MITTKTADFSTILRVELSVACTHQDEAVSRKLAVEKEKGSVGFRTEKRFKISVLVRAAGVKGLLVSKKILIVDDDGDIRELNSRALMLEDYAVKEAANGREAFALLDSEALPQLVLLDLSMPDMDGIEFMSLLRQNLKWDGIKVVLVSGWDDLPARAKQLGANGYLKKPFNLSKLYSEIEKQTQTPA